MSAPPRNYLGVYDYRFMCRCQDLLLDYIRKQNHDVSYDELWQMLHTSDEQILNPFIRRALSNLCRQRGPKPALLGWTIYGGSRMYFLAKEKEKGVGFSKKSGLPLCPTYERD